jgi:hypothetical protein
VKCNKRLISTVINVDMRINGSTKKFPTNRSSEIFVAHKSVVFIKKMRLLGITLLASSLIGVDSQIAAVYSNATRTNDCSRYERLKLKIDFFSVGHRGVRVYGRIR